MEELAKCPSQNLAALIVIYRALGIGKEKALFSMQELAKRRADGESFNYEDYITEKLKLFPAPKQVKIFDIIKNIKRK